MLSNLKLRSWLPALIALAMIIYGVITSAVNTRDNLRDAERVSRSREVLLAVQDTLRYMLDLETGQRGFIIVGDPSYLEPYESALKMVDTEIGILTVQTSDNPSQQLRVGMLKEVIAQRKDSLRLAIEARRERGEDAAIEQMKRGGGKAQMDRLRQITDEMRAEETALLIKRDEKLARSLRRTDRTVIVTGSVAIAAGATGVFLLFLFLAARDREQNERIEREKAEEADHAKSDFLAMMSHEIRTPMNSILGFGELLHDLVETPQQKHFASAILTSGNSLLSLINDILDLSKIEAGKIDLHPEVVLIEQFAENLRTLFSFRAEEKGLSYSVRIDPSMPPRLFIDALRLRQIVVNLVGNALKFCHEGSVTVAIRAEPVVGEETVTLHIEVADTGIGIPAEQVSEIFRPFFQVDSRQSREFQGTGLGLSISRRLSEAMGGTISVVSVLGKGSVFRVELPARMSRRTGESADADTVAASAAVDFNLLKPSKILVVDDVPLNRDLIKNYLAGTLHQVFEAGDGEQAIIMCSKIGPDVVLMDIRLPAMDGKEALARLRAREDTHDIPVIAVTASSLLHSQSELKSLFDGYADKPLNRQKLFHELAKFLPPAEDAPRLDTPFQLQALDPVSAGRDWRELCEILDSLHRLIWPDLVKLVPAQATLNFATQLADLAREHSCPLLAGHSLQLMKSAEMMDFAESSRLLGAFPEIIAALRAHA